MSLMVLMLLVISLPGVAGYWHCSKYFAFSTLVGQHNFADDQHF
jgi:hypothetical protein